MRGHAHACLERPRKVAGREPAGLGGSGQRHVPGEVRDHQFGGAAHLPGGQTASLVAARRRMPPKATAKYVCVASRRWSAYMALTSFGRSSAGSSALPMCQTVGSNTPRSQASVAIRGAPCRRRSRRARRARRRSAARRRGSPGMRSAPAQDRQCWSSARRSRRDGRNVRQGTIPSSANPASAAGPRTLPAREAGTKGRGRACRTGCASRRALLSWAPKWPGNVFPSTRKCWAMPLPYADVAGCMRPSCDPWAGSVCNAIATALAPIGETLMGPARPGGFQARGRSIS